jgi:hypothetical protein
VGRLKQLFIAPGPEEEALPTPPSAWHSGRYVAIPMEHWEVILEFAEKADAEKTELLRRYAYPAGTQTLLPPAEEAEMMLGFLGELQAKLLKAPPLVPEVTELFPEDFPNDDHAQMLEAVAAVIRESQRLGQPFEGDVDT